MATTFSLINFGCRASQADGAALKRQLRESGLTEAQGLGEVVILNTCTVTATADAEIRQTIRRIRRENGCCKILVTGCYAQRAPEEIAAMDGVKWVVGNSHKHRIPEILAFVGSEGLVEQTVASGALWQNDFAQFRGHANVQVGEIAPQFHFLPVGLDDRSRPMLKIQDGCDARCSFCIIPAVRGKSRSLPPAQIVGQIRFLNKEGYNEVVLSGINLGGYGRDLDRSITFLGLLEKILAETAIRRVRISSIEPMDVHPALIRLVAAEPRMANHFHVPLQSGSDRILRQMNRRYWAAQYAERIWAIRDAMPNAGIGADVMTGFPGETACDHDESTRFIESLPFTYLHIFPYSARPSTPASARVDQVNGRIAQERSAALRALIARKRQAFLTAQVGRTLSAVTLSEGKDGACNALSSNFLTIALAGSYTPSRVVDVRVCHEAEGRLYGEIKACSGESASEGGPSLNLAPRSALECSSTPAASLPIQLRHTALDTK